MNLAHDQAILLRTKESWTNGHRTVQQLQSAAFSALPIRVPVSAA
jgi:hypothetical protein